MYARTYDLPMEDEILEHKLRELLDELISVREGSPKFHQIRNKLFLEIWESKKIWCKFNSYYEDALQQGILEFLENPQDCPPPGICTVINWLNRKIRNAGNRYAYRSKFMGPLEKELPAPCPDMHTGDFYEKFIIFIQTDPSGKLRQRRYKPYSHINAQTLILQRLKPGDRSWNETARELLLPEEEGMKLAKWFWRYCKDLLDEIWKDFKKDADFDNLV